MIAWNAVLPVGGGLSLVWLLVFVLTPARTEAPLCLVCRGRHTTTRHLGLVLAQVRRLHDE
jgi:hypothetical protein